MKRISIIGILALVTSASISAMDSVSMVEESPPRIKAIFRIATDHLFSSTIDISDLDVYSNPAYILTTPNTVALNSDQGKGRTWLSGWYTLGHFGFGAAIGRPDPFEDRISNAGSVLYRQVYPETCFVVYDTLWNRDTVMASDIRSNPQQWTISGGLFIIDTITEDIAMARFPRLGNNGKDFFLGWKFGKISLATHLFLSNQDSMVNAETAASTSLTRLDFGFMLRPNRTNHLDFSFGMANTKRRAKGPIGAYNESVSSFLVKAAGSLRLPTTKAGIFSDFGYMYSPLIDDTLTELNAGIGIRDSLPYCELWVSELYWQSKTKSNSWDDLAAETTLFSIAQASIGCTFELKGGFLDLIGIKYHNGRQIRSHNNFAYESRSPRTEPNDAFLVGFGFASKHFRIRMEVLNPRAFPEMYQWTISSTF